MPFFFPPLARQRLYTSIFGHGISLAGAVTGRLSQGMEIEKLEQEVCRLTGASNALCMPQARVGIYFAIRALIKPGQKVILSPYTISDVINMIICAGGVPVFADIERETCNIDPQQIEELIDDDTGAVMVTHFYGLVCEIERIAEICRNKNIPLIEDAAQAFGAKISGKWAGTFGDAGIFSFGLYKNVTSYYGGMILTPHEDLRNRIASENSRLPLQPAGSMFKLILAGIIADIATFPLIFRAFVFWVLRYGYLHDLKSINSQMSIDLNPEIKRKIPESYLCRMSPMQAGLIFSQLGLVEAHSRHRLRLAEIYEEGLRELPGLILPPFRKDGSHQYMYYPFQFPDRHALVRFAIRHGRDFAISHHKNCASMTCFKEYARACPNAEATSNSLIYLPTYPGYSEAEARANVRIIRRFIGD